MTSPTTTSPLPGVRPRFRWWHALGIFGVANLLSALPAGLNGDFTAYNALRQPAAAPPDWLFGPAWLVLNVTSLAALARVANAPHQTRVHRAVTVLEGAGWVLFASFSALFFGLRSPVLGAVNTVLGLLVALLSLALALRIDRRAGGLLLLRVLWLALASFVSVWIALNNPDPLLGVN